MKATRPTVFPRPGTYKTPRVHVNIMSLTQGGEIFYTLDGSVPNRNSLKFDIKDGLLSLQLNEDALNPDNIKEKKFIIKAICVKEGLKDSDIGTFEFIIKMDDMGEFFYTILQRKKENIPSIVRIEDFYQTKMYFVQGSERGLLIDGGLDKSGNIVELLDTMSQGLPYDMAITHAHPDHYKQVYNLIDAGIDIYMNDKEHETLERYNETIENTIDYGEGHIFDLGDCKLKAFYVPGHTRGHMVLLDEVNGFLFSSDAFGNNRNTHLDTLFLQLGNEESTADRYLSEIQKFRWKTQGKINKIFMGHNDLVLYDEKYLDNLEKAVQRVVDLGEEALEPTLRPEKECFGSSKISLVGNYITDINWAAVNVRKIFSGNYNKDNIDTLSFVGIIGGNLDEDFKSWNREYNILVNDTRAEVEIYFKTTSKKSIGIKIDDKIYENKSKIKMNYEAGKIIEVAVIAPNNLTGDKYIFTMK